MKYILNMELMILDLKKLGIFRMFWLWYIREDFDVRMAKKYNTNKPPELTKIYYWRSEETPAGFYVAMWLLVQLHIIFFFFFFNLGNTLIHTSCQTIRIAATLEIYSCFL